MNEQICIEEEYIKRLRQKLHDNAEGGFFLVKTRDIITKELNARGVEFLEIGKGSVVARIGRGKFAVLLRADMDALPIASMTPAEETMDVIKKETVVDTIEKNETKHTISTGAIQESPAKQNQHAHLCGHDMHTAMLMGALLALLPVQDTLEYEVRFLFQAGEEILLGAMDAIESGVLDTWDKIQSKNKITTLKCKQELENKEEKTFVRAAFTLHSVVSVPMNTGTLIVSSGGVCAPASTFFELTVDGISAHGGAPSMGADALCALVSIYSSYHSLPSRVASMTDMPLLTVGELHAGSAPNIIADKATLRGTVRSWDDATQEKLLRCMDSTATLIARAYRTRATLKISGHAPTLKNDPELSRLALHLLRGAIGESCVFSSEELVGSESAKRNGGSEDFASFSHRVPSLLVGICAGDLRKGYTHPLHHPSVLFDEDALAVGARAYYYLGMIFQNKNKPFS